MTSARTQLLCLAAGPAGIVVFGIGFLAIAGLVPPPSPSDSAAQIQDLYQGDPTAIKLGLLIAMAGGALTAPFVAVIFVQMKRVEGEFAPLAYTQLGLGMCGVLLFIIGPMFMEVAAFRPDRDEQLILVLNDLGWLFLVGPVALACLQNITIALCAFKDTTEAVFPRWLGYLNIWVAASFGVSSLIFFFKSGPFAWNGLFTFWLPLGIAAVWWFIMYAVVRRAIRTSVA